MFKAHVGQRHHQRAPNTRRRSMRTRAQRGAALFGIGALFFIGSLGILPVASASAAGVPLPPPTTTPAGQTCQASYMGPEVCTAKTEPESVLYNALKKDPSSIEKLGFQPGDVLVTLNDKQHNQYQVNVTDATDINNIRNLALAANPPVPFSADAASSSGGGPSPFLIVGIIAVLLFGIMMIVRMSATAGGAGAHSSGGRPVRGVMPGFRIGGKHKVVAPEADAPQLTLADFIGQATARREAQRLIRFLKEPERLKKKGARVPKGVLLCGDSGEGKTYLARIIAAVTGANFIVINAPDLIEMYAGVGASRLGGAFAQARASQKPTIIFIDEIDAIGKARKGGGTDNGERDQTLTKLLTEMDGFTPEQFAIVVIAATNRPEDLDKALLRPGRFDRKVRFHAPALSDLIELYQLYSRPLNLAEGLDFNELAKKSRGLSAAHVANVCNEAAILSFEEEGSDEDPITQAHLIEAVEREIREAISAEKGKRFHNHEASPKLADVIGQKDGVADVMDVVSYFADPERYRRQGAKPPRGILLTGGPGLGKTLLARAVAGEAGVPFFSISGSEFVEEVVGRGAKHVREFFEQIKRNAPAIGFIDEIDAVGKKRGGVNSHDEREQTLNQLLTEMDGFDGESQIVILAATNRPETLDDALTRPGRFDREAKFYPPDKDDRLALFQYHMRDKQMAQSLDLKFFARNTAGASGADIANFCNEAALLVVRTGVEEITHQLLDEAILRCQMGAARNLIMSEKEKRNTAVHELGHTIVHHVESGGAPFARITIVGRAGSGGHFSPMNDDKFFYTDEELRCRIATALGGRKAQQLVLGTVDTGAQNDFQQARNIVHQMVAELGMSEAGILTSVEGVQRSADEEALIASEKKRILEELDARVEEIIVENRGRLDAMVEILLERETLSGPEFVELWEAMAADGSIEDGAIEASVAAAVVPETVGEPTAKATAQPVRRRVRTATPSAPPTVRSRKIRARVSAGIDAGLRRLGGRKAHAPTAAA